MPIRDQSRRRPISELQALIDQSGLRLRTFAEVSGIPYSTFRSAFKGRGFINDTLLNACRFTLLRLGHTVKIEPIVISDYQRKRGTRQ